VTRALALRTLGAAALWIYAVGASSPMTVLVGGVPTTYAATGVVGVPASFLLITPILVLLLVGYVAASQHVPHPAPLYALLARGLSPTAGIAGGAVAQLGYNAIGISLYGLLGTNLSRLGGAWWVWALIALGVVTTLGLQGGVGNARLLGAFLALELGVVGFYTLAALANPAHGTVNVSGLAPSQLLVPGVSGVFAFGMAAMVGAETPQAHGEEARPKAANRATLAAVVFLGLLYAMQALAMSVNFGPDKVVNAARANLAGAGPGPLDVMGAIYGPSVSTIANVLLVTSIVTAIVSFHCTVARYLFGMAREGVIPSGLAAVTRHGRGGVPWAGSLVQSIIAAATITGFAVLGQAPMVMFGWLSTIGAVTILALLVASAAATRRFFAQGHGAGEGAFVRQVAPTGGLVLGTLMLAMTLFNLNALLGLPPESRLALLVPALIVGTAVLGALRGATLRRKRPAVWEGAGRAVPHLVTADVSRLQSLEM
jgi:amino acid transporter